MSEKLRALINERLIVTVIVVNTTVIFLRGFPSLQAQFGSVLFAIDYACTAYFVVELAIKLWVFGVRAYFDRGWNRFDFAVVLLSSPMLLSPMLDLEDVAVILVLRAGRLLRSFRLLRFVPDAERLWHGIRRALQASVGVLIALGIYNFALGLCARALLGEADPVHFGDPIISIYSMFKVFTLEGWYEIPDAIAAGATPQLAFFARLFFVFAVTTGGLLGLSLANAVFVDEMVMDNTDAIEDHIDALRAEIQQLKLAVLGQAGNAAAIAPAAADRPAAAEMDDPDPPDPQPG